jgi:hypothetical protein
MVTAEIIGFESGSNGNILINVEYTLPNSQKVLNPYQAKYFNFIGKTQGEITAFVKAQIDFQCERYLENYVKDVINQNCINDSLKSLVGSTYSKDKVIFKVTDKGEYTTDQLDASLASQYVFVSQVEIDESGKITVTAI